MAMFNQQDLGHTPKNDGTDKNRRHSRQADGSQIIHNRHKRSRSLPSPTDPRYNWTLVVAIFAAPRSVYWNREARWRFCANFSRLGEMTRWCKKSGRFLAVWYKRALHNLRIQLLGEIWAACLTLYQFGW